MKTFDISRMQKYMNVLIEFCGGNEALHEYLEILIDMKKEKYKNTEFLKELLITTNETKDTHGFDVLVELALFGLIVLDYCSFRKEHLSSLFNEISIYSNVN